MGTTPHTQAEIGWAGARESLVETLDVLVQSELSSVPARHG